MPRPKSNPDFPDYKAYGFCIVIHNVLPSAKDVLETFVADQSPSWSVVSLEPYPAGSGYHLHIFVKWKRQHRSLKWFNFHSNFKHKIIAPNLDNVPGDWGRIDLKKMKGTPEEAMKYLTDPKKDKPVDPLCQAVNHDKLQAIDRWVVAAVRLQKRYLFPETHGLKLISVIEYCKYLESKSQPIPDLYYSDWEVFKKPIPR